MLAETLPTVLTQDFPRDQFEVIVVVDGSTDGTVEMLRSLKPRCTFRVLEQPNRGPATARNIGLAVARGSLVLSLDDDIRCERNLVEQHVAAHEHQKFVLIHGPIFVAPGSPRTLARLVAVSGYECFYGGLMSGTQLELPQNAYVICNSSISREALLACGGFDESMPLQRDDCELGLRLWKMGIKFQYHATAIVHEVFVKSSSDFASHDAAQCGIGEVRLCRKHPEFRRHSALANLGRGSLSRRVLRSITLQIPLFPVALLTLLVSIAERLQRIPTIRSAGIRLLKLQRRLVFLRSAAREAGSWRALRQMYGIRLPVLLYHNIAPLQTATIPVASTISARQFELQVRWLAKWGYSAIRPSEWIAWCRGGKPLPSKPVLLTFDDAYAGVAEYALPVLRRYGFSAAVFVVTRRIGGTNEWDRSEGWPGTNRLMSSEQITEWAGKGIEFGAHSRTHPDLTMLSESELTDEVAGSSQDLAALLGRRIGCFAYPFGPYNAAVTECTANVFDMALTCDEGLNDITTDPRLLRRTLVHPGDWTIDFACRIWFGWSPVNLIRSRLRVRSRLHRLCAILLTGLKILNSRCA